MHVPVCESTQDLAQTLTGSAVVWADEQRAGRGRQGRAWHGAPELDLELTFRIEGLSIHDPPLVAAALPAVIAEVLEPHADHRVRMKWPNDLMCTGRKLAGVLIDATGNPPDSFLVGIGINVNRTTFPSDLTESATSLALCAGTAVDREAVLLDVAQAVDEAVRDLETNDLERLEGAFRERLGLLGKNVVARDANRDYAGELKRHDLRFAEIDGDEVRLAVLQSLAADASKA